MKKWIFLFAVVGLMTYAGQRFQSQSLCHGFIPENDQFYPVGAKNASEVTEEDFNEVLDIISEIYTPYFEEVKEKFKIVRKWTDGTVNAYATRAGGFSEIHMFGGLARHTQMTKDGFAMVACHEIGHHLGGKPKYKRLFQSWPSVEGQSDYFASIKCMRKYFEHIGADIQNLEFDPYAQEMCEQVFKDDLDIRVCLRNSLSSKTLASVLSNLRGTGEVHFNTPDPAVVQKTDEKHPAAQCRLDTYFQGALCDIHHSETIDRDEVASAQCTRADGYEIGVRPFCWYKP